MTRNWKKFAAEKKLDIFLIKIAIKLSLGLRNGRTHKLQEKPSALKKHEISLQQLKLMRIQPCPYPILFGFPDPKDFSMP